MELVTAMHLARELMRVHGVGHWAFQFDRAKRRLGACHYRTRTISLSAPLTRNCTFDHIVRDTILHEIAHAKAGPHAKHGPEWKAIARALGANPRACHSGGGIEPVPAKWTATCPSCTRVFRKHRLARPGARRWCLRCGPERGLLTFRAAA